MVNGYSLVKTIAVSKDGEAHLVRSDTSSSLLYLKTVRASGRIDAKKKFYRETNVVASLEHPNILRPLDVRFENDALHCIYPYVNGRTLHELLGEQGRIGESDALSMMKQLLGALSYVHARGIIHANVNPWNIIISHDTGIHLFDFGSSLTVEEAGRLAEGVTVGMFPYLSPEQTGSTRFKIDTRTDLYCASMVLYRCVAGALPFYVQNGSIRELLDASIRREVPGIKHVPQFFNEILLKGLRPSPIDRYQTADGMLHDVSIAAEKCKNGDNIPFVVGERDAVLSVNRKRLFVVREKELRLLSRGLGAFAGNRMVSYLVCGKSGIGKTELIRQFKRTNDLAGIDFLEAKCNRFSISQPGSIYRQVVIEFLHHLSKNDHEEKLRIRELINTELQEYSGLIGRILPEMNSWFDVMVEVPKVEPEKEKDRFIQVLTRVLTIVCSLRKCIIHFDDVQWIDRITAEVMFRLLEQKLPCFFICTFRTGDTNEFLFCHGHDLTTAGFDSILYLNEFNKQETDEFIGRKFKSLENPGMLVEALHEKTDGNPYLLNEAVRYLVSGGHLTLRKNLWNFAIENIGELPPKFDAVSLVLQKLHSLADDERKILQMASLIQGKFDAALVNYLSDEKSRNIHEVFAVFETNGFILSHLSGGYAFVHDRIQETIANDVPREQRYALYGKLSRYFSLKAQDDKEMLFPAAEYVLKSDNARDAITVCFDAALYAMEKNAYDIAIRYLRNIILLADADHTRCIDGGIDPVRVNILLGDVLMLTGANEQALDVYARIIAGKQLKNRDKLELEYKIGSIYHHTGEFALSSKYLMQSLATVGITLPKGKLKLGIRIIFEMAVQCLSGTGFFRLFGRRSDATSLIIVKILNKLAFSLYFNDMVRGYYVHFKALNLADRLIDSAEKAESYSLHQIPVYQILMNGRARSYLRKAVKIADRIRRKDVHAFAETFGGLVRYFNAQWREAEQLLQNSIRTFRSIGDLNNQIIGSEHLWKIAFLKKPLQEALAEMDRTVNLCGKVKDHYFLLITRSARNLTRLLATGTNDDEEYGAIQDILRKVHSSHLQIEAGGYLLQTDIERHEYQRAYDRASGLLPMILRNSINSEYQVRSFSLFCSLLCREFRERRNGRLWISENRRRLQRQFLLYAAVHLVAALSYPAYRGRWYRNIAWICALRGMTRMADRLFRRSIRAHHQLAMRFEEACSLHEYGEFLEEFSAVPGNAYDRYVEAYELFKWCGARLYLDRMEARISAGPHAPQTDTTTASVFSDSLSGHSDDVAQGINHLRFETLVDVSKTLTEVDDPRLLLRQILSAMITVTGAQYGCLFINKLTYGDFEPIAMSFEGKLVPVSEVPVFTDLIQKVNEIHTLQSNGEPLVDEEVETESICIRSDLCVPLNWREKYLGYVYLVNDRVLGLFGEGAQKAAMVLAAHAGILLENAWLMQKQKEFNEELQQQVTSKTDDIVHKNQQLEEANLKLIESERMKGILSGTLVHDIKNYAAGITGNLIYLGRRMEHDEKAKRVIDVVCETCSDITSLASNLLDIAKMDDGKMVVREEILDYRFFKEVACKFGRSTLFEEKEIIPEIIPPDEDFTIGADVYLMERLLQNLYSNAAKYAPRGSRVELRFGGNELEQVICFFNSGTPIPDTEKEILFEKYARIQSRHSHYSKGLGLFFCRMVMNAHRGRIWLDTDPSGNYFKLAFPRREGSDTEAAPGRSAVRQLATPR